MNDYIKFFLFSLLLVCFLLLSCGPSDKHVDVPYLDESELRHMKWSELYECPEINDLYTDFRGTRINGQNLFYRSLGLDNGIGRYVFHNSQGVVVKVIDLPLRASLSNYVNFEGDFIVEIDSPDPPEYYDIKDILDFERGSTRSLVFIKEKGWSISDNPLIVNEDTLTIPTDILTRYKKAAFKPIELKSPYARRDTINIDKDKYRHNEVYQDSIMQIFARLNKIDSINDPQIRVYLAKSDSIYLNNIQEVIDKNVGDIYKYTYKAYSGADAIDYLIVGKHDIAFVKPKEINDSIFPSYTAFKPEPVQVEQEEFVLEEFDYSHVFSSGRGRGNLFSLGGISYYNLIHGTDTIQFKSNDLLTLLEVIPKNKNNKTTFILKKWDDYLFMEYDYNQRKDNID